MPDPGTNECFECGGTGEIGGEFHILCLGTGKISTQALHEFLKTQLYEDFYDKLNDLKEKVDEIHTIVSAL